MGGLLPGVVVAALRMAQGWDSKSLIGFTA